MLITPASAPGAVTLLAAAAVVPLLAVAAVPAGRPALRGAALAAASGAVVTTLAAPALVVADRLDALRATLLVFAAVLAAVAAGYSRRHLDGDPAAGRYRRHLLVASAAAVATVAAADLVVLAVAWVAAGRALVALVGHHTDVPLSSRAVAALRRAFLVGDTAFVAGLAAAAAGAGSTAVADVAAWAAGDPGPLLAVAGAGVLAGTASRSAQWPFSRWLPLSVVAPAPVSALLHAGIANAPVVVLLALEPVWQPLGWFAPALLALGLGTAALTFVRLLVRADLKTRLAWSTTAQLGFMLALVAVGAHAAAVLHLVLHGLYKANAFLRAGDDIARARADRPATTPRRTRLAGAAAGLAAGAVLLALDVAWHQPLTAVAVLVAAAAGGYGLWTPVARPAVRAAAALVAVVALALVLAAAGGAAALWDLPLDADGPAAWTAAVVVLALAAAGVGLRTRQPVAAWAVLHRAADPALGLPEALRARRAPHPVVAPSVEPADAAVAVDVRTTVEEAAAALPPSWGWQGFVAANPLWGSRSRPFADALADALAAAPRAGRSPAETVLDDAVAGWLAAWTAPAGPPWPAPHRDLPLWAWFRTVAVRDPLLAGRTDAVALPADAVALVGRAAAGAVAAGWPDAQAWARDELVRLTGWSAHLARRGTTAAALDVDALVDLLAVRVATRLVLTGTHVPAPAAAAPAQEAREHAAGVVRGLEEAEARLRSRLAGRLLAASPAVRTARAEADLVFCIDARSERLRRHLEAAGPYRTAGFAGFFGLPLARAAAAGGTTLRLPALLAPALRVDAAPVAATVPDLLQAALRAALDAPGGGFAAVEVAGVRALSGIAGVVRPRARRAAAVAGGTVPDGDRDAALAAAVGLARAAGLGPSSAPLVVLVGHGSTSTNNTAASAYDCGACGGYRGGTNAAVAAALLNSADGRQALAAAGLALPAGTVVVAAEHDTALDEVVLPAVDAVPAGHRDALGRLAAALEEAAARTAVERCAALPGAGAAVSGPDALAHVRRRAADPAQVRHEWGLAGNAAIVAAPRALTAGLDLQGTAFLHEYDADRDTDGRLLETILTAPVVVAHWINAQYLFSGLDPERWGSGSKTAHNPVGTIGVLSGAGGDLRVGLPEQAVRHGGVPRFPLVRLLVVVAAAPERVDAVLDRHPDVAGLVTGGWLALWAVPPGEQRVVARDATGWHAVPAAAPDAATPVPHPAQRPDDRLAPVG